MEEINGELLFTAEEIKKIEGKVHQNPWMANPNLVHVASPDPTNVNKVTPKHSLIIPEGNEYTGFDHIWSRHEFWSEKTDWIDFKDENDEIKKRPQNQSKFGRKSIPFLDYAAIADSLYTDENRDDSKASILFDLYEGKHVHEDGASEKYRMLLYKNSKVIHTLFPKSNRNNQKKLKGFHFARGNVSINESILESKTELIIPYTSAKGKIKYSVVFRELREKGIGKVLVYVHDENENRDVYVEIGHHELQENESLKDGDKITKINTYQFGDLRHLEKWVKLIDEDRNK